MQVPISFLNALADAAGAAISRHFRQPFAVEAKGDSTPVTIADREAEAAMRRMIEAAYPDDGILGEEYGVKESRNGRTWVLDPIDGTKSFVVGRPTFGTLIALCEEGVPVAGVIDQPILKERWISARGQPTTFNRTPVRTTPCPDLSSARCGSTSPSQIPQLWPKLYAHTKMMVWGGDCYSYGLMAMGGIDVIIESGLQPYDFAALVPVVTGAGGQMCDWDGKPLTLSSDGRTIALGDARLKEQVLGLLKN
jgi:inositol-phosphate phosphatase/L-galactose 1-phosphate phosphatase/histidinol-phosphatase